MKHDIDPTPPTMREPLPASRKEQTAGGGGAARRAYSPPRLERLGAWSALTLQQSIPIFP